MKLPGFTEYTEDTNQNFETFQRCFADVYEHEDLEVLRLFAPIAKALQDKELPEMKKDPKVIKVKFSEFVKNLGTTIQAVITNIPNRIKHANNKKDIPKNIREQKGRKDISFEESISTCSFLVKKIAPSLKKRFDDFQATDRIIANDTMASGILSEIERDKEYIENRNADYREASARISKYIGDMKGDPRLSSEFVIEQSEKEMRILLILKQQVERTEKRVLSLRKSIEPASKILQRSQYISAKGVNLRQHYNQFDALTLVHELAHAETDSNVFELLCEVPSITAEIVADNYMEEHGMGSANAAAKRLVDCKAQCGTVVALCALFEEYERLGTITTATTEKLLSVLYELSVNSNEISVKKPDNYSYKTIYDISYALHRSNYFVGTGAAFAIAGQMKRGDNMQHVFDILSKKNISNLEKLRLLGVNKTEIAKGMNAAVRKNRTKMPKEKIEREAERAEQNAYDTTYLNVRKAEDDKLV
jgi:hypothetical protein